MNLYDPRHTPGPWSAVGGEILNQSMTAVGFVFGPDSAIALEGHGPPTAAEALANERLILAAPELFREAVRAASAISELTRKLRITPWYREASELEELAAALRMAVTVAALDPYFAAVAAAGGVN